MAVLFIPICTTKKAKGVNEHALELARLLLKGRKNRANLHESYTKTDKTLFESSRHWVCLRSIIDNQLVVSELTLSACQQQNISKGCLNLQKEKPRKPILF